MIKSVIPCFNFPFFARVVLCGVTHISQSEPDFQFIMCCARVEEENVRIFVPLSVLFLRKRSFWSFFTGPGRLQVSALGLELWCALSVFIQQSGSKAPLQQASAVFPVHSLSAQALTCKELVNSQFLREQLCGKAASLSKLILSYVQIVSAFEREGRWNLCG